MKKAMVFGGGNIGRGFVGQLFSQAGYEVVFADVNDKLIKQLNKNKEYPLRVVSNDGWHEETIKNVRAIYSTNTEEVIKEIQQADIIATSVGAGVLSIIAPAIAKGIEQRICYKKPKINILLCENLMNAGKYFETQVSKHLDEAYKNTLTDNVGFVECSIGRMVPVMTEEMQLGDVSRIWVEPYDKMPVDKDALVAEIDDVNRIKPFSPFSFYVKQKLFIHNLGHAACAYLGVLKDYTYIYQAVSDEEIRNVSYNAMCQSAKALSKFYDVSYDDIHNHIEDLLNRFGNKALGDTTLRVGKDPLRKLDKSDRIAGAALFCASQDVERNYILQVLKAALKFYDSDDKSSIEMRSILETKGTENFLKEHCGFSGSLLNEALNVIK